MISRRSSRRYFPQKQIVYFPVEPSSITPFVLTRVGATLSLDSQPPNWIPLSSFHHTVNQYDFVMSQGEVLFWVNTTSSSSGSLFSFAECDGPTATVTIPPDSYYFTTNQPSTTSDYYYVLSTSDFDTFILGSTTQLPSSTTSTPVTTIFISSQTGITFDFS